ncbi:hypothetical protein BG006_006527 [Podila minutissima]|uniref:Threonine/serine exporter-like N-terminal domain-containing protein n=1 Tax=Podila minutissima TaxID=64525 RepID=A0A9P5SMG9_9FUNG|nr:hypothetical protein BG006_006527 [Podila minutissima]
MVSNTSFTLNHERVAQDLSRNMASSRVLTPPSGGILSNLLRIHALSNPPPSSHHRRRRRRRQSLKSRKTVRKPSSVTSDVVGASSSGRYKLSSRNASVVSLPGLFMGSIVGLTPNFAASSAPPVAPSGERGGDHSPIPSTLLGSSIANDLAQQLQPPIHPFDIPTTQPHQIKTHPGRASITVSPTSPRAGDSLAPETYLHRHYSRHPSLSHLLPPSSRSSLSADDDGSASSLYSTLSLDPAATALRLQQQRELTAALADILQRHDLLIRLCKSFIRYGAPSHRIELAMEAMCRTFGVTGSFAFLPGLMMISFGDSDTHTSETHLIKCVQGFDMGRLAKVHRIARAVVYNHMDAPAALAELKLINAEKTCYGVWATLASYAMCSGLIAPLVFKGSWYDMAAGMGLGLVVGLTSLLASRYSVYSDVFEVSTSIVIAFVAKALRDYVCFTGVVLSGIVVLLPGLSLTTAIMELSSRYMISGSVRMFYSLIYCLFLGFGLSIGSSLWDVFREPAPGDLKMGYCHPATEPWRWVLFPLLAIAFNIQLNAQPRQWPVMIVCSSVGYAVSEFAGMYWPHSLHIAAAVSAFVVGLLGNLYERLTHELAFVPILGAILLIVPGGMGVRSSLLLLDQSGHASQGTAFALQMIVVALGIAVGLFASTLVVYPLGKKRNALLTF